MRLYTLPNVLSLGRLISAFIFLLFWYLDYPDIVLGLLVIMYISDFLDGFIARYYKQVSFFGQILDPLADKIMLSIMGILLFYLNAIPGWFIYFLLCKDIFLILSAIWIISTQQHLCDLIRPLKYTKLATFFLMKLFGFLFFVHYYPIKLSSYFITIISFIIYLVTLLNIYAIVLYIDYYYSVSSLDQQCSDSV